MNLQENLHSISLNQLGKSILKGAVIAFVLIIGFILTCFFLSDGGLHLNSSKLIPISTVTAGGILGGGAYYLANHLLQLRG